MPTLALATRSTGNNPEPSATNFGTGAYTPSGTYTVPDGALVIVCLAAELNGQSNVDVADMTVSSSLGHDFQVLLDRSEGNNGVDFPIAGRVWVAQHTTGSFSLTFDWGARNAYRYVPWVLYATNYNTEEPIGALGEASSQTDNATSIACTLGAAPAEDSVVVSFLVVEDDFATGDPVEPTGFTNFPTSTGATQSNTQYPNTAMATRTGSTSTAVGWGDVGITTYNQIVLAFEVRHAEEEPEPIDLDLPLVQRSKSIYLPTAQTEQGLSLPLVARSKTVYAPTLGVEQGVFLPLAARQKTVFPPTIEQQSGVDLPLLARQKAVYPPQIASELGVSLPFVQRNKTIFLPEVEREGGAQTLNLPFLQRNKTIYLPSVAAERALALLLVQRQKTVFPLRLFVGDVEIIEGATTDVAYRRLSEVYGQLPLEELFVRWLVDIGHTPQTVGRYIGQSANETIEDALQRYFVYEFQAP